MYTRCPECETTFRVGVDDLRRAQGKVRCGDCEHVFNAVESLTDQAPAEEPPIDGQQPPVLAREAEVFSSADNPHREDTFLEPANETGVSEILRPQDESYELEIKTYDERTGETWSPLDVSEWETGEADADVQSEHAANDSADADNSIAVAFTVDLSTEEPANDSLAATASVPESPEPAAGQYSDAAASNEPPAATSTELSDAVAPSFGADVPAWLQDTPDAMAAEQSFDEEVNTQSRLRALHDSPDEAPGQAEPESAAAGDTAEPWAPATADEPELLDDDDTETALEVSQTIEMLPLADTEGLPTLEMHIDDLQGDLSAELPDDLPTIDLSIDDSPAPDTEEPAETEGEALYDDFTGIDELDANDRDELNGPVFTLGDTDNLDADLVEQGEVAPPDAAENEAADADGGLAIPGLKAADFDDTIWESIPGVGAAEARLESPPEDDELKDGLSYTDTSLFGGDATPEDDSYDLSVQFSAEAPEEYPQENEAENEAENAEAKSYANAYADSPEDDPAPAASLTSSGLAHYNYTDLTDEAAEETKEEASAEIADEPESKLEWESMNDPVYEAASEPEDPATSLADAAADAGSEEDGLGFNVPEDKWETFFGTASKPQIFNFPAAQSEPAADDLDSAFDEADADTDENEGSQTTATEHTLADAFGNTDTGLDATADNDAIDNDQGNAWDDDGYEVDYSATPADEAPADDLQNSVAGSTDDQPQDSSKADAPTDWSNLESIEEVIMATGEFGAVEIHSSLTNSDTESSGTRRTYQSEDWRPKEWQATDAGAPEEGWQPEYLDTKVKVEKPSRKGLWTAVIFVLALGFATQLLHYNRDALAANQAWGEDVRAVYNSLGMELYPAWPVDSYEIRGSEAVTGESGENVLDIRTQIAATSTMPVGLPHLRVILRDRWSNPVAARNFAPTEYAAEGGLPASGLLLPNETVAAHIAIVDPGSGAQGFELEMCVPRRNTGLDCTGQPFK